jgi:hypothetical protein
MTYLCFSCSVAPLSGAALLVGHAATGLAQPKASAALSPAAERFNPRASVRVSAARLELR